MQKISAEFLKLVYLNFVNISAVYRQQSDSPAEFFQFIRRLSAVIKYDFQNISMKKKTVRGEQIVSSEFQMNFCRPSDISNKTETIPLYEALSS